MKAIYHTRKIYAVFEGARILKMSESRHQCVDYINSFSEKESKAMFIVAQVVESVRKRGYRFISEEPDLLSGDSQDLTE